MAPERSTPGWPRIERRKTRRPDYKLISLVVILFGMAGVIVSLVALFAPSADAVRLRNSFISSVGRPADFTWIPANIPPSFLLENGPIPVSFRTISQSVTGVMPARSGEFAKALLIARHLMQAPRLNGGVQSSTWATYQSIVTEGRGYCADFTQVFNGIAIAAGIPVREWGMAFNGYGGQGHAFNEIYDAALHKWIMLDSFNSFYVRSRRSGIPLSVQEFRSLLLGHRALAEAEIVPIVAAKYPFTSAQRAINYYQKGMHEFYLTWGNNVSSYDNAAVVRLAGPVSRPLEQQLAIMAGGIPGYAHVS